MNSVDMTDEDRFPYIELEKRIGEGFFSFPWHWRIVMDEESEERGWGGRSGLASTRWGALWSAKREFRKYLKTVGEEKRIERITL